jgi:hypothetical protein
VITQAVENRSEFRLPLVVPVEYFSPHDQRVLSYTLDLSKSGAFISSDDHPIGIGTIFRMNLNLPSDEESSEIFRTEGAVVWNRIQPFKSKRNGMGVKFTGPLPESLLLNALADQYRKLMREIEASKPLTERSEKLELELERAGRFAALARYAEKILPELSSPLLTLSGKLEKLRAKMYQYKRMLEEHGETNKEELKKIVTEFDESRKEIDHILKDYKILSDLGKIIEDNRETLKNT